MSVVSATSEIGALFGARDQFWQVWVPDCLGEPGHACGERRANRADVLAGQAKRRLRYRDAVDAPCPTEWSTMLDGASYRSWAHRCCASSYYGGSGAETAQIRLLFPECSGMTAADRRQSAVRACLDQTPQHQGSRAPARVRQWASAFENYSLRDVGGSTELEIEFGFANELEQYMSDT